MAEDYSYLGSGIILIREWNSNLAWEEVGNVSAYTINPQTNTLELADNQNPGGGMANSVDRVTGYNVNYTFHDFKGANFARALRGKVTDIVAATKPDEPVRGYRGSYVPLEYLATEITSVVGTATGASPYKYGEDYWLERGMLFIPIGSSIPDAVTGTAPNLKVTYKYGAAEKVEAGVTAQKFYEMKFVGANEARSGKMTRTTLHKVKGGVIENFGLIGNEFGAGTVAGAMVKDPAKAIGPDKSAYFVWDQEK